MITPKKLLSPSEQAELIELFKECYEVTDACGKSHAHQGIIIASQKDLINLQSKEISELRVQAEDKTSPFIFIGLGLLVGFGMSKL